MAVPALILFDDRQARCWEPFALTRPVGDLLFGAERLVDRAQRLFAYPLLGYLTAGHLADFQESGTASVVAFEDLPGDRDLLFWCSRAVPDTPQQIPRPSGATLYLIDGRPVGFYAPAGEVPDTTFLTELRWDGAKATRVELRGRTLEWIWDALLEAPEQLARDLPAEGPAPDLPRGTYREGAYPLIVGRGVRIEPGVLFDTRDGPIELGDEVEVRMGTRLAGPAAVGARCRLLGGSFERVCAGPYSYLRGEISASVFLGYTNKAHDGYLGQAYVGKWVNLGAHTTNSNLKNNYGPVRVWTPSGIQNTGHTKVGCFLGDHVKTGIGTLLGTGTVVGAGANLYGSTMPPRYVEPFSWGEGSKLVEYRLAEFLGTAERVMSRRGVELDERGRRYLESCWRKGRGG